MTNIRWSGEVRIYEPDEHNPCYVCHPDNLADMDIVLKGNVYICETHRKALGEAIERHNKNKMS